MPMTHDQARAMFGCPLIELRCLLEEQAAKGVTPQRVAFSILSDAQELIAFEPELARQAINRAKWMLEQVSS